MLRLGSFLKSQHKRKEIAVLQLPLVVVAAAAAEAQLLAAVRAVEATATELHLFGLRLGALLVLMLAALCFF